MQKWFLQLLCRIVELRLKNENENENEITSEFHNHTKGKKVYAILTATINILLTAVFISLIVATISTTWIISENTQATMIIIGVTLLIQIVIFILIVTQYHKMLSKKDFNRFVFYILVFIFLVISANPYKEELYNFIINYTHIYFFSMDIFFATLVFLLPLGIFSYVILLFFDALHQLQGKNGNFYSYCYRQNKQPKLIEFSNFSNKLICRINKWLSKFCKIQVMTL
jgi:hypothetical protein